MFVVVDEGHDFARRMSYAGIASVRQALLCFQTIMDVELRMLRDESPNILGRMVAGIIIYHDTFPQRSLSLLTSHRTQSNHHLFSSIVSSYHQRKFCHILDYFFSILS